MTRRNFCLRPFSLCVCFVCWLLLRCFDISRSQTAMNGNCVRYFCAEQKCPPMSTGGSRIFGWHSNCCTLILTSDSRTVFEVAHATGTSCNQIKHSHSHTTHNHTHTQNGKQTALAIRLSNKSTLQMLDMQAVYYMRHSMCNGARNVHLCESVYVCESATPHAPMFVLLFCGNTDRPTDPLHPPCYSHQARDFP